MDITPHTATAPGARSGEISQHTEALPRWLTVQKAVKLYSIGRSTLYAWIYEGKIRSACLKADHQQRGKRLIDAQSLDAFINSMAEGGTE